MDALFTQEAFREFFAGYFSAIWPAQPIAYLLGIIAFGLLFFRHRAARIAIAAILAVFWFWNGTMYHIAFLGSSVPAAAVIGLFFVLQGFVFLYYGIVKDRLRFEFSLSFPAVAGMFLMLYGIGIMPLLGPWGGHAYPRAPIFGVVPCPTVIFTFGILLLMRKRVPAGIVAVPLAWCIICATVSAPFGMPHDYSLGVLGLLGTAFIIYANRASLKQHHPEHMRTV